MPKNSALSSKWAIKNLADWWSINKSKKQCPVDILLLTCSKEILGVWLCVYVNETRKQDDERYSPKTLYALLCGILKKMRAQNPTYPNFLDRKDPDFTNFTITLDNLFKFLRSSGIGAASSHTEELSNEDEDELWVSGIMNVDTYSEQFFLFVVNVFVYVEGKNIENSCF